MFFKKTIFFFIILLLILSIYKDITTGTTPVNKQEIHVDNTIHTYTLENNISLAKVRLAPGDTVLSVTEELNQGQKLLDITEVMNDFTNINPSVDPYHLQPNHSYLFPLY